jgi:hypothetical protein
MTGDAALDEKYRQILIERMAVCKAYRPKFGQGQSGVTLADFQNLYGSDPFYAWLGLDNPLMYAAHKAAGGITSIYRQIGIGGEELFRQIIQDHLGLEPEQARWSYQITTPSGIRRTLKLDGRIELGDIPEAAPRRTVTQWMYKAADRLRIQEQIAQALRGIVFEVRQGYKSKDSKRQKADIANAAEAYVNGYLPVLVVLSNQIDNDIVERYERGKWLVLRGVMAGDDTTSTYVFTREILGYDLAAFFRRNSEQLRRFTEDVLESLLRANDDG